ncbi:MAG: hypothetical protein ABID71_06750 [Chloroflexota bacterium]
MKKVLVIGLVVLALSVTAFFAIPAFAHWPTGGDEGGNEAWQAMHEACEEGDWEAMAGAAEAYHEDNDDDHCSFDGDEDGDVSYSGWGGMMGGGMMGGWR